MKCIKAFRKFKNSLDLKAFDQSLKLKWLEYLHRNNTNSLHLLMSRYIKRIIEVNWQINILPKDIQYVLNSCKNKFVETILVCIKKIMK